MGKACLSFRFSKPVQLTQYSTPFLCQQDDMATINMAKKRHKTRPAWAKLAQDVQLETAYDNEIPDFYGYPLKLPGI